MKYEYIYDHIITYMYRWYVEVYDVGLWRYIYISKNILVSVV